MYLGAATTWATAALSLPVFKDSPLHDGSVSTPPSVLKFGHDLFSREQIQASPDMFRCERCRIAQGRAFLHSPIPPLAGLRQSSPAAPALVPIPSW